MSSSSSSDDENEKERKRKLREAVCGVNLPSTSSLPPSKKAKVSKRGSIREQDSDLSGQLVTSEMQTFLAKKLSESLDKQCEFITCTTAPIKSSSSQQLSSVKLLSDSKQPISLEPTSSKPVEKLSTNTKAANISETESSESDTENCRLKEAAIDARTLLSKK